MNKPDPTFLVDKSNAETDALLIAGVHRSGTSALARVVSLLGAELPKTLMSPAPDNPEGFWESAPISDLNDEFLGLAGSSWDDPLASAVQFTSLKANRNAVDRARARLAAEYSLTRPLVLKDPRIALLMEFWLEVFGLEGLTPAVVVTVRNPLEVASSLGERNRFSIGRSLQLWLAYTLAAERGSRGVPRIFVRYSDLLSDWRAALRRVQSQLGIRLPLWTPATELQVDAFLSHERRHHRFDDQLLQARSDVPTWVRRVYSKLIQAAEDPFTLESTWFDEVANDFGASLSVFAPVIAEHQGLLRIGAGREAAEKRRGDGLDVALQSANHELNLCRAQRDSEALFAGERALELDALARELSSEEVRASSLAVDLALQEKRNEALLADLRAAELRGAVAAKLASERAEEIARLKAESKVASALLHDAEALAEQREAELVRLGEEAKGYLRQCGVLEARAREAEQRAADIQGQCLSEVTRASELELALSRAEAEAHAAGQRAVMLMGLLLESEEARSRVGLLEDKNEQLSSEIGDAKAHVAALEESVRALNAQVEAESKDRIGYTVLAEAQSKFIESTKPIWRRARRAAWRNAWVRPLSDLAEFLRMSFLRGPGWAWRVIASSRCIRESSLFDTTYYLRESWDVRNLGVDPAIHYSEVGWIEGRDPSPQFSTSDYLKRYPDVAQSGANPLLHYLRHGRKEGRITQRDPLLEAGLCDAAAEKDDRDLYQRRPDTMVGKEAVRGARYMEGFRLDSDAPDFAGAVAALNATRIEATHNPEVSVIVPVYGQLSYTLNCLHSLMSHVSKCPFEILVVDDHSPDATSTWLRRVAGIRVISRLQNGGFIEACNDGARQARGRTLVFLNNDTRVVEGWLDALVDSLRDLPDADVVGSKLFYADGSLQEAGGLIWSDASAWNFGRGDDPGRPEYCYARPVDYVSGASLAISSNAWSEIGGFDQRYSPAYCEDADLCLKIRYERRRQVWFQPRSRVIHYEGKTSGTDLTQGAKAHQISNTETLRRVWGERLKGHRRNGECPLLEKDRGVQRRALVIEATTPEPKKDAGSVTCVAMMTLLQESGYKVTFVPEDNMLFQPGPSGALQAIGIEVLYAPFEMSLHDALQRRANEFDLVLAFRFGVTGKHLQTLRSTQPRAPVIMHCSDLHFLREERHADLVGDPILQAEAAKTKRRELSVIDAVDVTVVHSPVEREILGRAVPDASVCVFPFIQDVTSRSAPFSKRRDIAFLGGYRHRPNVDAVLYFVERIWPLIRARDPHISFIIAGSECPVEIMRLDGHDNIKVVGFVDDLEVFFSELRLSVAPIRYGAGVKGKVATALGHGLPTVLTSCAGEGMGLRDGEAVLIRDDDAEFAEAVLTLYHSEALWTAMSKNAITFVEQNFGTSASRQRMAELLTLAHVAKRLESSGLDS